MFPTTSLSGSSDIPPEATFWMPRPEDIDEEGIGEFRGTWLIKDVPVREAQRLMRQERRIAEVVGRLAATAEDFDRIARAVEDGYDPDEPESSYALNAEERAALDEFAVSEDEPCALDDLELGVAGLVYVLATVRIIPAASCRGYTGDRTWSEVPVVLFATTEYRAQALQPLDEATGCYLEIDAVRSTFSPSEADRFPTRWRWPNQSSARVRASYVPVRQCSDAGTVRSGRGTCSESLERRLIMRRC